MSGQPLEVLTGGAGFASAGSAQNANQAIIGTGANLQPHHGVLAIVLFAVAVLFLLDRAGFRFAVTAGKR